MPLYLQWEYDSYIANFLLYLILEYGSFIAQFVEGIEMLCLRIQDLFGKSLSVLMYIVYGSSNFYTVSVLMFKEKGSSREGTSKISNSLQS